jgi:hypothetical protein
MKKSVIICIGAILWSLLISIPSEAQSSLGKSLSGIKGNVKEIQLDKITYRQSFDILDEAKGKVRFLSVEVNDKGTTSKSEYEFYISDIDKNTIIRKTSGKKLVVSMSTFNKQKFVKLIKGDKLDSYCDNIEIVASDGDVAQALMDNIKSAILLVKNNEKTWASEKEALTWLTNNIKEVANANGSVAQAFKIGDVKEYLVSLSTMSADSKGAALNEKYEFNILDINKNKIMVQVSGVTLSVNLEIKSGDKFIKYTKNNQAQNNINNIDILTENLDQARGIISALNAAIEKSKPKMAEYNGLKQATDLIQSKTTDITIDAKTIKQKIEFVSGNGTKTNVKIVESDSKGNVIATNYEFYLADINPESVNFEVSGKKVSLVFNTVNKTKLIKYTKDNVLQNFVSNMEWVYSDIETSREVVAALQKAIKLSSSQPRKWTGIANAMKFLEDSIKGCTILNDKYELTFEGDYTDPFLCKYTVNYTNSKGVSTETSYLFYPNTLDPASVHIESSGKYLSVVSSVMGKESYIKKIGKVDRNSYRSELEIMAFDSKDAKNVQEALIYIINTAIPKEKIWATKQAAIDFIKESVGNFAGSGKEVTQKLDIVDNEPCKLAFKINTVDDKGKNLEEIYEFNLSDMNKLAVGFQTSSGNVYITLICKNKQKLVKVYKNGVQQSYCSNVEIVDDDIDTARNIVAAFKVAIAKCEQ